MADYLQENYTSARVVSGRLHLRPPLQVRWRYGGAVVSPLVVVAGEEVPQNGVTDGGRLRGSPDDGNGARIEKAFQGSRGRGVWFREKGSLVCGCHGG